MSHLSNQCLHAAPRYMTRICLETLRRLNKLTPRQMGSFTSKLHLNTWHYNTIKTNIDPLHMHREAHKFTLVYKITN